MKKTVAESATILSEVMMPIYANHYGSVYGGKVAKIYQIKSGRFDLEFIDDAFVDTAKKKLLPFKFFCG